MKPRNKYQEALVIIQKKVRPIPNSYKKWFIKNCFEREGILSRKRIYCTECGEWTKSDGNLVDTLLPFKCFHCKEMLTVKPYEQIIWVEKSYGTVFTTCNGFQIIRFFMLKRFKKRGKPSDHSCTEVLQHWIDKNGKRTVFSVSVNGMTPYYDTWSIGELKLRGSYCYRINNYSYSAGARDRLYSNIIYPRMRFIPELYRNGFQEDFYDNVPQYFMEAILSSSKAETLLKTGQYFLLQHFLETRNISLYNEEKFWASIRICIRNKYIVTNPSDWFDYLELLSMFGKDLHNPKYVCPANFKKEHNRYVEKRNKELVKQKMTSMMEKIQELQEKYFEEKNKFFNIRIENGIFHIEPIASIKEFVEEGMELNHCIFVNEYFKKRNSLILSARIGDKRIETVEVLLDRMTVSQARGLQNQPTEYHDEIVELVNKNISLIQKAMLDEQ